MSSSPPSTSPPAWPPQVAPPVHSAWQSGGPPTAQDWLQKQGWEERGRGEWVCELRVTRIGVLNLGLRFKIQDLRFEFQDMSFKVEDSRFRIQVSKSRLKVQGVRCKVYGVRCKV